MYKNNQEWVLMAKKGGSGLAILALLVGIVAIGLGGYNYYSKQHKL